MQRWEYKVINASYGHVDQAELDRLGEEGWELVTVNEYRAYLKRPFENNF